VSAPRTKGFTLLEVVVALVLLQVALLGVLGLFSLSSTRLTQALLTERAAAEVAAVADSLSRVGTREGGESIRGDWRVRWEVVDGGLVVRGSLVTRQERETVVELRVP
jgi:type II secretory pathway pseudopilin PulG